MVRGGANLAAVFGRNAIGLLHSHVEEIPHAAPHERAGFFIQRLDFIAFFNVDNFDFVVDIPLIIGIIFFALTRLTPAAKARIWRDAQAVYRQATAYRHIAARLHRSRHRVYHANTEPSARTARSTRTDK